MEMLMQMPVHDEGLLKETQKYRDGPTQSTMFLKL